MTTEEKDRIIRAEEIQRYTENRCITLEKENEQLKRKLEDFAKFTEMTSENHAEEWENQQKVIKELKEKLKGFESGNVAWQGDMDRTIEQNLKLKEQVEQMKNVGNCKHCMECSKWVEKKLRLGQTSIKCCQNCEDWELADE